MLKRRFVRYTLIAFGAGLLLAIALFGVAWALTPIPDAAQKQAVAQGSVIYYRDGKTVLAKQGVNRKTVKLERVPKHVRDAVIAAENRTFYEDKGVSLRGTARAVWSTVTGKQVQGGSTITQQMVRNYYSGLNQERSLTRKFKEIMVALKVDQSKSKDWVLQQYLNTIYFGRGAWGVQAASQAYFGKDVEDLSIAQGAYLAAVIQQPSRYADPKGEALTAATDRWRSVLTAMTQIRALTPEQVAEQRFPKLAKYKTALAPKGQENYMLDQVRAELAWRGFDDEDLNQGGLKVTTTFDKKLMAAAEKAVTSTLPEATPKKVRTGLAAVDPATGEVVAFYGGRYRSSQYDNAFSAKVQAGSTFKPYTLAAALENGYDLSTRVNGNSPMRVASSPVKNSGGTSYGMINLVTATRNSVNTAFVDLGSKVGLDKVAETAKAVGLPAAQIDPHASAATLPLGVASVSAVQQASGFAAFAAGGMHNAAHVIRSVTQPDGTTTEVAPVARRAFSEQTATDATYAMTQVVEGGTGTAARLWGRPVAGKTGTTDASAAVWFAGYTPQLAAAVDMFRDDNEPVTVPGYGALYGGTLPARVWQAFMTVAMEGEPVKEFPEPSDRGWGPSVDDEPYWNRDRDQDDRYTPDPQPTEITPTEPSPPQPTDEPTDGPPPTEENPPETGPPGPEETTNPNPDPPNPNPPTAPDQSPPDRANRLIPVP
ncbi:transglycosylase domain-containing protein [Spongiactinospora sp. TRM90649]|uniref:transglycosylase domain-containing protein n=1 Tax=Spongiactinospora sp. TRM90649 TaxID=3031114 RepID=UPI0023F9F000|nr:transglycosylase domain-containing protein [Spongiactinospora sp. TRM90649]MDF5754757.1 transglycosylase domain-containing protein [Spongiactinospora sp. TRM90649]